MQANPPDMTVVVHVAAREKSIVCGSEGGEGPEREGPEQGRPAKGLTPQSWGWSEYSSVGEHAQNYRHRGSRWHC